MTERKMFRSLNMDVVLMTPEDAASAQARFDTLVEEKTASGEINHHNFAHMYEALWRATHDGCDAVTVESVEHAA